MKRMITLMAVTVFSSTTALAETSAANVTDIKTEVLQKVETSVEKAMASTKEVITDNAKAVATPVIQASEVPVIKIETPTTKKPMIDEKEPNRKMQKVKRPDGPMPEVGIRLPQMNSNMPPKMPMMKKPQGNMPRMMSNQQRRMPAINAPQGMMPMFGSTGAAPSGAPMMPNQGYYMPMMNMQAMYQKQSMMQQHRMRMENHMANIEALLKELVELQKSKK